MSKRVLSYVLGGVAGLVVLYAMVSILSGRGVDDGGTAGRELSRALATAAEASVIRIGSGDESITLEQGAAGWTVNGERADSAKVDRLLSALDRARVGHLASANPTNHTRLGVDEGGARVVEFVAGDDGGGTGGSEIVRLLVGHTGSPYPSVYLRLAGRDEVFLVHGSIRNEVLRGVEEWRSVVDEDVEDDVDAGVDVGDGVAEGEAVED